MCKLLIDTFPSFINYWKRYRNDSTDVQIDHWAKDYLSQWPELLEKQILEYQKVHLSWRAIAKNRIFPRIHSRLDDMIKIHDHLIDSVDPIYNSATSKFNLDFKPHFVVYVGIGHGAGWATKYNDHRAILFGLENAAEMGWTDKASVRSLIAHELGHLTFQEWRFRAKLSEQPKREGPYWRIYSEGFATTFEREVTGRVCWPTTPKRWLHWCRHNRKWLAKKFLTDVNEKRSTRAFFGSWYTIRNHTMCGYFLGHENIGELTRQLSLRDIATLKEKDAKKLCKSKLSDFAKDNAKIN